MPHGRDGNARRPVVSFFAAMLTARMMEVIPMRQRPRVAWLPFLLGLYLLAVVGYIVATRGGTILAGHPAYTILLAVVTLGALCTLAVAMLRRGRV